MKTITLTLCGLFTYATMFCQVDISGLQDLSTMKTEEQLPVSSEIHRNYNLRPVTEKKPEQNQTTSKTKLSKKRGYITDRDGIRYDTIHFKGYAVMMENLRTKTYANGDKVTRAKRDKDWKKYGSSGEGLYCRLDNSGSNERKYGLLYNKYAITDSRGLLPEGWKVPSRSEWGTLFGKYTIIITLVTDRNIKKFGINTYDTTERALWFRGSGMRKTDGSFDIGAMWHDERPTNWVWIEGEGAYKTDISSTTYVSLEPSEGASIRAIKKL